MARDYYYPKKVADQPPWHFNFAEQLPLHGATVNLSPAAVAAAVNDARHLGYSIGAWLNGVRDFSLAGSGQVEVLKYGTAGTAFVLPEFTPPTLPVGLTAVLPGALARIFNLVKVIKGSPGYTEGIGMLLGIVGPELPLPPPGPPGGPRIFLSLGQIPSQQQVLVKYYKDGHQGIWIECRRGTGDWEYLWMQDKSPYIDNRPLLVPGQVEVREYRAMFIDNSQPHGLWCDVAKITVSP